MQNSLQRRIRYILFVIIAFSSQDFLYAQNVFPTPSGNVGIGTSSPAMPLHVIGESWYNGLGWFSRNNNGSLTKALQLGQNNNWDYPVVTLSTMDASGENYVNWRGSRHTHHITFEREGSTGPKKIVRIAGYDGGNQFLTVYANDGETSNIQLNAHSGSFFMNNLGIGINDPASRLHIADGPGGDQLRISRGTGAVRFAQYANEDNLFLYNKDGSNIYMAWRENGNIGIGTINPQAKLAVNGDVFAKKVKVTQTGWSDFVFDTAYKLRPLKDVEQFIQQHKHLPEIPSADSVVRNGLDLGANQALLLQKIEELTLYIIQQQKQMDEMSRLNNTVMEMKKEIEALKKKRSQ